MNNKLVISILGILANIALMGGKITVGFLSHSTAIIADGINSATDIIASLINYIGIHIAEKPADEKHPYGHGKAEVLSGFVITIFIFISGVFILYDAIKSLFFTQEMFSPSILAFGVMGASALINLIMSQTKIHFGKKHDSVSLISDGVHSRIDFLVSLGIFLGLFLIPYVPDIDAYLAIAVGLYIIKEAISLGRETSDALIGKRADAETEAQIRSIAEDEGVKIDMLRTQKIGSRLFAELSVKLPASLKVKDAQKRTKTLEQSLIEHVPNLEYTSISIQSHDIDSGYYKPAFSRGFGWRRGRMQGSIPDAHGAGPGGKCVCPECGKSMPHEKAKPCSQQKCPVCGTLMQRSEEKNNTTNEVN